MDAMRGLLECRRCQIDSLLLRHQALLLVLQVIHGFPRRMATSSTRHVTEHSALGILHDAGVAFGFDDLLVPR